jgi:N-acyl-D-aspartate/D-glutamate deacylase
MFADTGAEMKETWPRLRRCKTSIIVGRFVMSDRNHPFDTVIRRGLIVDGSGQEPFQGDIGIKGDQIVAVGSFAGAGIKEINARDCMVTPGFVDVHTHFDGQAIWSHEIVPSSLHGVTTVVMGNCGVGFAPCRPKDRQVLIAAMEGVEDIPGVVMVEGLTWDWETYPEYLDAVERQPHDINIGSLFPHSPLRVYVMGERGANREPATEEDLERMAALTREAMEAGALGFATSANCLHRTATGAHIASYQAAERELRAIAAAIGDCGRGVFQIVPDLTANSDDGALKEIDLLQSISNDTGVPVTFTLVQMENSPNTWRSVLDKVSEVNRTTKASLRPQIFPRPVGMLIGFDLSLNPFALCPSYKALADLPLERRMVELRKPEVRARIVDDVPDDPTLPLSMLGRMFNRMYELGDPPNYEPPAESNIALMAARLNVTPAELAYDVLLKNDGHAVILICVANYCDGNLDNVAEMIKHPDTVVALGDGGAHYGLICDASYPTFLLSHWTRDRKADRFSVAEVIKSLTATPAALIGLHDRGLLKPGYKADINVIDYDSLAVGAPIVTDDLPAGGRRLAQHARGYRWTLVNGQAILCDDKPTGALPGRLLRGSKHVGIVNEVAA